MIKSKYLVQSLSEGKSYSICLNFLIILAFLLNYGKEYPSLSADILLFFILLCLSVSVFFVKVLGTFLIYYYCSICYLFMKYSIFPL